MAVPAIVRIPAVDAMRLRRTTTYENSSTWLAISKAV
jgi:hypothetical protein